MTRPEEPLDDRAMQPPSDPWATINRPVPTVYLGGPDTTAHLPGPAHGHAAQPPLGRTVHLGPAPASAARADGEVRFGPGVPPAPVATPGWPAATAPTTGRRRPLWRRLVSVLSSLLTLALVVVVGLYLWQRLSPLELEGASVAVPEAAGNRCDVTVDVVATVRTNGRSGAIRYQWFRSDAQPGGILTEQIGSGQRTAELTLKWTFNGVGSTTETATINIIEPSPLQAETPVAYRCKRD